MITHSKPYTEFSDAKSIYSLIGQGQLSVGSSEDEALRRLSAKWDYAYSGFTGNGSQSLFLILKAMGIGEGDEVIMPTYVCDKVYYSIQSTGATPVLCDNETPWLIGPESARKAITKRTKAVILVHLFGINAWHAGWEQFPLPIIEDHCQSLGFNSLEEPIKGNGIASFTSFHGTKPLGIGEGGAWFTNNENLMQEIKAVSKQNALITKGTVYSRALLLQQTERLPFYTAERMRIAAYYLSNLPEEWLGAIKGYSSHMYFRFTIQKDGIFEEIKIKAEHQGVQIRKGMDTLLHQKFNVKGHFQKAENDFERTISLPIYPGLSKKMLDLVIHAIS